MLRPGWRLLVRALPREDAWGRVDHRIPLRHFGPGARHDFEWYFEGESAVEAKTLDDVLAWLLGCEYQTDLELFHERDFWQHPRTFEKLRRGDCEDHALWAWRKLLEIGIDADFVSGRSLPWQPGVDGGERGHAWVIFRDNGQTFVLESVAKAKERMVQPLADAASQYRPEFGVDRNRKRFAFNGYFLTLREREFGLVDDARSVSHR
jgi:hypothetical protein